MTPTEKISARNGMTAAEIRQKPPRYSGRQRSGSLEFSQQYQNRIITKRQNMYQGAVLFKQPPDSIHEPIQNAFLLLLLQRQSLPHIDKFIVFFYPQIIYHSNTS